MSKLTKNPEKSRTGMAVTGPTNVATWSETGRGHEEHSREEAEDIPSGRKGGLSKGQSLSGLAKTRMVAKNRKSSGRARS